MVKTALLVITRSNLIAERQAIEVSYFGQWTRLNSAG